MIGSDGFVRDQDGNALQQWCDPASLAANYQVSFANSTWQTLSSNRSTSVLRIGTSGLPNSGVGTTEQAVSVRIREASTTTIKASATVTLRAEVRGR